eukprot:TRINITY_DN57605_c0_g1_i1.p1 TRINITY_DN57605_c0_g1~~TRINITY_DN57605_c0_g1_i1.p1  ORF type:complete len:314 (+),score=97.76 TRINITY_DN57605_c0_g1_i1:139-1080(+)
MAIDAALATETPEGTILLPAKVSQQSAMERTGATLVSARSGLLAVLAFVCMSFAVMRQTMSVPDPGAGTKVAVDSQVNHLGVKIDRMNQLLEQQSMRQVQMDEELKQLESSAKQAVPGNPAFLAFRAGAPVPLQASGKGGLTASEKMQSLHNENVRAKVVVETENRLLDGVKKAKKEAEKKLKDAEGKIKKEEGELTKAQQKFDKGDKKGAKNILKGQDDAEKKAEKQLAEAEKSLEKARSQERDAEVVSSMVDISMVDEGVSGKLRDEAGKIASENLDVGQKEVKVQVLKARLGSSRARHNQMKVSLEGGGL